VFLSAKHSAKYLMSADCTRHSLSVLLRTQQDS